MKPLSAALVVALLPCVAMAMEPAAAPRTWAVIASASVRQAGIADLVTVELSRRPGIHLVEREKLAAVTDELALARASSLTGGDERLRLGRQLQADAVVCLSGQQSAPRPDGTKTDGVRLVIADTRHGVRLENAWFPLDAAAAPELARTIAGLVAETRERLAGGVLGIVAVPPFVCRNLTHEQDHLQGGFAAVVSAALARLPGVAVVELEEARAVGRELELSGADVAGRLTPLFVEGQFESRRDAKGGGPIFSLRVDIGGAAGASPVAVRDADLVGVTTFLNETLPVALAKLLGAPDRVCRPAEQFARLATRAETLAALGDITDAVTLREAALLLDPQAAEQRRKLIGEVKLLTYDDWSARCRHDKDQAAPLPARTPDESATLAIRNLDHLDHLIRNRQLSVDQALAILPWTELSLACEDSLEHAPAVRRFLAGAYQLIPQLEPAFERDRPGTPVDLFRRDGSYGFWEGKLFEMATARYSRESVGLRKTDLDFLVDLARHVARSTPPPWLPERPVGGGLRSVFQKVAGGEVPLDETCTEADYLSFLQQIERSTNPRDAASGRLGRFWWRWRTTKQRAPLQPWLQEAKTLSTQWAELFPPGTIRNYALVYVESDHRALGIGIQAEHWSRPGQAAASTAPSVAGMPAYEAVQVEMRSRSPSSGPTTAGVLPFNIAIRPCGVAMDMAWIPGDRCVWAHRRPGIFEEIWSAGSGCIHDVAWDGEHVWIAAADPSITVLSPEGAVVARIGEPQGLPPADHGLLLHVISTGTVCAIGSFGPQQRAWCGLVSRGSDTGKVNVFHEARRVPGPTAAQQVNPVDPAWAFVPVWIRERRLGDRRQLVVGRQPHGQAESGLNMRVRHEPLVIDVDTLRVSVQECGEPTALNGPALEPYFLADGDALIGTERVAAPGKRLPDGAASHTLIDPWPWTLAFPPRWLSAEGALWLPGASWYRVDPTTLEVRRLGPGLTARVRYLTSALYGLMALTPDRSFRIDTAKLHLPSTEPPDAPINVQGLGAQQTDEASRAEYHFNPLDDMVWFAKGLDTVEIRDLGGNRRVEFFSTAPFPRRVEHGILLFYGIERLMRRPAAIQALGISPDQVARLRAAWERVHGERFDTNETAWQSGTRPMRLSLTADDARVALSALDAYQNAAPADKEAARERLLATTLPLGDRARADFEARVAALVKEVKDTLRSAEQQRALQDFADGIVGGKGY